MSSILRQATTAARTFTRTRTFATTAVARKDLVQDLYIKELKGYKAPPTAKDAHVGSVHAYSAPAAPTPPSLPADLASELSAYDAADPVRAAVETKGHPGAATSGAEEFLTFLEADEVEEAHH